MSNLIRAMSFDAADLLRQLPQDERAAWLLYAVAGLLLLLLLLLMRWRRRRRLSCEPIHRRRQREAKRHLRRLARLPTPGQQMDYLQAVNPFVFEEMILTALKRRGHRIERNTRYSHDGGIDGRALIRGRLYLIQAKRYSRHLPPEHIQQFAGVCRDRRSRGLLIHTGRVSENGHRLASKAKVEVVGGDRLLRILLRRRRWLIDRI